MLTEKANATRIDGYTPSEAALQKQKTQSVPNKERQASARAKQPPKAAHDNTLNQIMFAQQAYLNNTNFEKLMIE